MLPLEAVLRRDRAVVLAALGAVILASWAYVLAGAGTGMPAWKMSSLDTALGGAASAMAMPARWDMGYAGVMVGMWWAMMLAMMLPSAAPMILLHAAVGRRRRERNPATLLATGLFAWGYAAAWGVFSVLATGAQWIFEAAGILSPMAMNATGLLFAAAILAAAGLYQLSPAKQVCLRHCRGPLGFLMGRWRAGRWGAFRMGAEHGAYCLGCCWALMGLLFFGGVMNLYWIAGLALLVLLEKTVPAGDRLGKAAGALLVLWAAAFAWRAVS